MSDISGELEDEGIPTLLDDEDAGVGVPRDFPQAVDDFGTTAAEQREGESFESRTAREAPDVELGDDERVGRLLEPQSEVDQLDTIAEPVASDTGEDDGLSAEEAAMHVTDQP